MATIELSAYIEGLREELGRAVALSQGRDLRFFNDKVELELEIGVETEITAKAETKFRSVVFDATLGSDGKKTVTNTQTIKLSLVPYYKNEKGAWTSATGLLTG
jgi:Trypsin-co-occurring domain 2